MAIDQLIPVVNDFDDTLGKYGQINVLYTHFNEESHRVVHTTYLSKVRTYSPIAYFVLMHTTRL